MTLPNPPQLKVAKVLQTIEGIEEVFGIESESDMLNYAVTNKEVVIFTANNGLIRLPLKEAKVMAEEIIGIYEVWNEG